MKPHRTLIVIALTASIVASVLLVAGCGSSQTSSTSTGTSDAVTSWTAGDAPWSTVVQSAKGQTVNWWLYGGDDRINAYIDDVVGPRAKQLGITINRVPVDDTATAVSKVVAEARAGKSSGGAVDLIWINGENFASGKQAQLWLGDSWATKLPNAVLHVDWSDPSINRDLGVAVDGQESPWSRAALVWAYDSARTTEPPRTLDALLTYAKRHPGRVTYPAPPDFTGSAFVRYVVTQFGEDRAFAYLKELKPYTWRQGSAYPKSEAELNQMFGNGTVDFAFSYDPSFVESAVRSGTFAKSARPFVPMSGTLTNVSYVTIPSNAAHPAAALVLANLLLDSDLQAKKADPAVLGVPTVLRDLAIPAQHSQYLLANFGAPVPELAAAKVAPIEQRWKREVGS